MPLPASVAQCTSASRRNQRGRHTVLVVPARAAAAGLRARPVPPTVVRAGGFGATVAALVVGALVALPMVAALVAGALVALPMVADPVAMPADPIEAGIPTQARFP
ncbi:hypothetical protein [Arthrobacter sp.]|uniref:hypothetical protein n=1 Tax=Arthrobacter sp. TaxID=1667 RepID=UPI0028120CBC|nr:hypothetical protein [Arthrobacter sp.]